MELYFSVCASCVFLMISSGLMELVICRVICVESSSFLKMDCSGRSCWELI